MKRPVNDRGTRCTNCAAAMLGVWLMLGQAGCKSAVEAPAAPVNVAVATVSQRSISDHVTSDAVLFPLAQAAIAPKVSSPVRKFLVRRGEHVKAGQLLAVLENGDLAAATMDSRGGYDQALATYQTTTKAQVPEDYQKAQLDVEQSKANLDVAKKTFESRQALFAEGALPRRDLDTAKASLVQAQAADDIAKRHFESVQSISHAAALKSAKGQLDSAQGKYLGAQAQLSYSEIRSPINGVVTDRPLYPGETAAAGTPLITVMDTSVLLAKLHLPQGLTQRLKVGGTAQVKIAGIDNAIVGKVSLISPALDPGSTTIEVWVRIENPTGDLKPGTPATVSITGQTISNADVIPAVAITAGDDGKKTVMVFNAGVARKREVKTGIEDGGMVQILGGLQPGEQVITTGAYAMEDGTKVRVATAAELENDSGAKTADGGKD